jgi:hypothetical protein
MCGTDDYVEKVSHFEELSYTMSARYTDFRASKLAYRI